MNKLTGTIRVHGSEPAIDAVVEIHNHEGDVVDQVIVNDDGSYTYHLTPGRWSLRVWDSHGHRGTKFVDMSGNDMTIDMDLDEPVGGH
ncbi:MAG: carboxypeptidase-like regulatory domain-containing protein [Actinomycetota bacterium]